jgi:hypothetical protein
MVMANRAFSCSLLLSDVESAKLLAGLGEGYFRTGDHKKRVVNLKRALEKKESKNVKEIWIFYMMQKI